MGFGLEKGEKVSTGNPELVFLIDVETMVVFEEMEDLFPVRKQRGVAESATVSLGDEGACGVGFEEREKSREY